MAMALAICGLGSDEPVEIDQMSSAEVSYPGFVEALRELGAVVEEVGP